MKKHEKLDIAKYLREKHLNSNLTVIRSVIEEAIKAKQTPVLPKLFFGDILSDLRAGAESDAADKLRKLRQSLEAYEARVSSPSARDITRLRLSSR